MTGMYPVEPCIAINSEQILNPNDVEAGSFVEKQNLADTFRLTASVLDEELYLAYKAGRSLDPKDQQLYWGLMWLALRAKELGVTINYVPSPDQTKEEQSIDILFSGMGNSYIDGLLAIANSNG